MRAAYTNKEKGVPEGWDELVSICQLPGNSQPKKVHKDRDWKVAVPEEVVLNYCRAFRLIV